MLKTGRQIIFPLLKLSLREMVRSVSLQRNLLTAFFVLLIIGYFVVQFVGIAIFLGPILRNVFDIPDIPAFLNMAALYYLLFEFISRFFLQRPPLVDLKKYLHLPIRKSAIVQFMFVRSLVSLFSLAVIVLLMPVTLSDILPVYGATGAFFWLGTLFFLSMTLHFLLLCIKRSGGGLLKAVLLVGLPLVPFILLYFDMINIGAYTEPFFALAMNGPLSMIIAVILCFISIAAAYSIYKKSAYTELPAVSAGMEKARFMGGDVGLLSRFGLPGIIANTDLKLILRHKKSRGYLIVCVLFLFYGMLFYSSGDEELTRGAVYFSLFIGAFITGSFLLQYGQLLLSWNSASFDFYMTRRNGLFALMKGKYLLLAGSIVVAFILTIPYAYYGWEILAIHTAALFYNIGIGIHIIIYLALWQPKPMDINKGAMFNYDGVGVAQFVMIFPYILLMYIIYFIFDVIAGMYAALFILGGIGFAGILFRDKLLKISADKLRSDRHPISTSFRNEL
ncbi:hypothetical protein DYD21_04525 [Rhodohalobacter sp. SW132]|uniref:DUF5687 family protein n=1 Tax=Rhodohalobacter sp. SW132 TaxID=2293433 RepID=UPI000E22C612|nr:DUF5687 family protein [Rhodohalobacter sp. SW132]REL39225.1 hypothetical protein DYD21_04525 [Rhodohalobacter sp. SW132]